MPAATRGGPRHATILATAPECCGPCGRTALDRCGTSEGSTECLRQSLRAFDNEEPRLGRVEPALDEIVNERLDGRGVLRCALDEAERMFVAHRVNTDRCDEDQISSM